MGIAQDLADLLGVPVPTDGDVTFMAAELARRCDNKKAFAFMINRCWDENTKKEALSRLYAIEQEFEETTNDATSARLSLDALFSGDESYTI